MPKLKDKQLWHICEYGSRKEMKEAINKLCGALYCTGEEEGYRSGFECGYDTRKKEGDSNG